MGIVDKNTVTLHCPRCDISETISALEKGSAYGSSWTDYDKAKRFDYIQEPGNVGPRIASAKCKHCAGDAIVTFVS